MLFGMRDSYMRREDISKTVGGIDEELIEEVLTQRKKEFSEVHKIWCRTVQRVFKIVLPIAACIAAAEYPTCANTQTTQARKRTT